MKDKNLASCIKCSVIIPTFNREKTIRKALEYFDEDFYLRGEVIVVDDASEDQTCAFIEKEFPKVKILKHLHNQGAAAARNTGIKAAQGDYVAFLDSDDVWYPEKLSKQLSYFKDLDQKVGGVFSAYHYNKGTLKIRRFEEVIDWFEYFLKGCFISPGSGLIVRRKIFEEIGFFDEKMKRLEDWDWLLRLSQQYSLKFINDPLFCVNYSGKPNSQDVIDATEVLSDKWLKNLSGLNLNSLKTSLILEKLIATRRNYKIFWKIFLHEVLLTPKAFLSLFLRVFLKK